MGWGPSFLVSPGTMSDFNVNSRANNDDDLPEFVTSFAGPTYTGMELDGGLKPRSLRRQANLKQVKVKDGRHGPIYVVLGLLSSFELAVIIGHQSSDPSVPDRTCPIWHGRRHR